jgi:hypothetical protein
MQYFACNLFSKQIVDCIELEPYSNKVWGTKLKRIYANKNKKVEYHCARQ